MAGPRTPLCPCAPPRCLRAAFRAASCPCWKRRSAGKASSRTREREALRALKKMDLNEDEDVLAMLKGSRFCKIRSLKWHKERFYRLQEDCMTVWFQRRFRHPKSRHIFYLQHIEDVREGHQSEGLRRYGGAFHSSCCLTITFKGQRKNLDLAAPTEEEAQRWVRGLTKLRKHLDSMNQRDKLDHWIHGYLHQADSDHDSKMSFKEIKQLLQMVNVTMDDMYAALLFKECDRSQNERLEDAEIEEFLLRLLRRPELEKIFNHYSGEDQVMSASELLEFLRDQGEEGATLAQAQHLIHTYELNEKAKQHDLMTLDGFMMYLLSPDGDVLDPTHKDVYQDMNQPLSHYFISSSHNTYLTQSQIGGASSTESYIRAFATGCRCVELDCWDGPDGEPVVYHGYTMTSKILFRDVIQTVRDHAFLMSPYPVILSLENHCGMQQQSTMAYHLRTILGNMLVTETLDGKIPKELPSPEQLKGKILVKGKKQIAHQKGKTQSDLPNEDKENEFKVWECPRGQKSPGEREGNNHLLPKGKTSTKRRKSFTFKLEESVQSYREEEKERKEEQDEESEEKEGEAEAGECSKQTKTSPQISSRLSDLVIYCCNSQLNTLDLTGIQPQPCRVPSLSEYKAKKFIKEAGNNFVRHNICQLCRVYPSGLKMTSANFNPQEMWNGGCQLVALNFQTPGREMDLNNGRFLVNGRCGYFLKPHYLRQRDTTFDPEHPRPPRATLIIQVLTAQQLPKLNIEKPNSIVDPLVRVEIHGIPSDCAQKETNYVLNNGFNPSWEQTLQFTLGAPELALVRFVVKDYDATSFNDFVGQFTLPLGSLKQGYRHIHLFSKDGASLSPATLFVHIQIKNQ